MVILDIIYKLKWRQCDLWLLTVVVRVSSLLVFFFFFRRRTNESHRREWGFFCTNHGFLYYSTTTTYNYTIYRETTSEQSQTLSWFIVAGEISLERQNLAHSSSGGDFQLESQHWREENVLFSVVEAAAAAAPMLTQTPAVAADLRSNYFWYQSRSVRWLDKKLKDAKKKN